MKKTLRFKFAFLFAVSIIIIFSMFCTVAVPVSYNANAEKSTPKIIEKKHFVMQRWKMNLKAIAF